MAKARQHFKIHATGLLSSIHNSVGFFPYISSPSLAYGKLNIVSLTCMQRKYVPYAQVEQKMTRTKITKNSKFPIMIDEEGSTVSRLSEVINHKVTQKLFGDLYKSLDGL